MANEHGVKIKLYCSDNLRFNDALLEEDCMQTNQKLSYYRVERYHQNCIAELEIKY